MNKESRAQRPEARGARLCPPRTSRSGPDSRSRRREEADGPDHARRARILPRLRSMRTSLRPEGRAPAGAAPSLVPEGRQRTLAGGKSARADVAPGWGGKRAVPRRGIGEKFPTSLARTFLSRRGAFFDAPPGHGPICDPNRGRRPLARTCPRLISCGVPPGRSAGVRADEAIQQNTAEIGRAQRGRWLVGRVCPQRAAAPFERPTGALRTDAPYLRNLGFQRLRLLTSAATGRLLK